MKQSNPCHTFDSDEPIQLIEEDCLGFTPYVCALYQLIKHNLPHDASFTIGIFGDWGTGKTSVMRMLQNLLARYPEEFVTLFFDAWAFEEFDNLFPPLIIELSKLAGEDRTILKMAQEISESIARIAVARATEGELLWDDIKKASQKLKGTEESKLISYKEKIENLFDKITRGHKKLVIFLDDLDRVHEREKVINLLEDLQTLMDFPNVVYIIAADRDKLMETVKLLHASKSNNGDKNPSTWTEAYFEKIIQLPILLPQPSEGHLQHFLIKKEERISEELKQFDPHRIKIKVSSLAALPELLRLNLKAIIFGESWADFVRFLFKSTYYGLVSAIFLLIFPTVSLWLSGFFYNYFGDEINGFKYFWPVFISLSLLLPLYITTLKLLFPLNNLLRQLSDSFSRSVRFLARIGRLPPRLKRRIEMNLQYLLFLTEHHGKSENHLTRFKKLYGYFSKFGVGKPEWIRKEFDTKDEICSSIRKTAGRNFPEHKNFNVDIEIVRLFENNPRKLSRFHNLRLFYRKLMEFADVDSHIEESLIDEWAIYMILFQLDKVPNRSILWEILLLEDAIARGNEKFEGISQIEEVIPEFKQELIKDMIKKRINSTRFGKVRRIGLMLYPFAEGKDTLELDFVKWVLNNDKAGPTKFNEFIKFLDKPTFKNLNLAGVNFANSNLTDVTFENCDLSGANFKNAILSGAKFINCKFDYNTGFQTDISFSFFIDCKGLEKIDASPTLLAVSFRNTLHRERGNLMVKKLFQREFIRSTLGGRNVR